jgi:hypothetical protein
MSSTWSDSYSQDPAHRGCESGVRREAPRVRPGGASE